MPEGQPAQQDQPRYDFAPAIPWYIATGKQGAQLNPIVSPDHFSNYEPATFHNPAWKFLDHTQKIRGDFSVVFPPLHPDDSIGFIAGPFLQTWQLPPTASLSLHIRCEKPPSSAPWLLALTDSKDQRFQVSLQPPSSPGEWTRHTVPLPGAATSIDLNQLVSVAIGGIGPDTGKIWIDDLHFLLQDGTTIGVTDKSIDQWVREEEQTRPRRVQLAARHSAAREIDQEGPRRFFNRFFSRLLLGQDLPAVNAELCDIWTSQDPQFRKGYELDDHWSLFTTPMLYRLYFNFGHRAIAPGKGRLEPKTEACLLELLWERTQRKNDIHWARQNSWWMVGSENHDLNGKVSCLLASQIFMHEPDYRDRILPDHGTGGGYGYWFAQMYNGAPDHGPEDEGDFSDGGQYDSDAHYKEWLRFFREYLLERVRRGFFIEHAASGYMNITISFLNDIADYCEDPRLRELARKFLDLVWIEWAQDQLGGMRGGAKNRWVLHGHYDAMLQAARALSGGTLNGCSPLYYQLTSNYAWPRTVWEMALDREGKGCFAYLSRKPGEENPDRFPRPAGTERSILCDTESRYLRYSWVTPDYILGSQMDHPHALNGHLVISCRWLGMSFSADCEAWVGPCAVNASKPDAWHNDRMFHYRAVQHRNVAIVQQCRRWLQADPEWFPCYDCQNVPFGMHIGSLAGGREIFDHFEERGGCIFLQCGNAYLALRPLRADYTYDKKTVFQQQADGSRYHQLNPDSYEWDPSGRIIRLHENFSPILMEAARQADYPDFNNFIEAFLDNPPRLRRTVAPGWFIVEYRGLDPHSRQITFNAANMNPPRIDGKAIDYAPPFLYDSPFLQADYGNSAVTILRNDQSTTWTFDEE